MTDTRPKFLRLLHQLHYLYLVSIPGLATLALGMLGSTEWERMAMLIGGGFGVAVYLGIIIEVLGLSEKILKAISSLLTIPILIYTLIFFEQGNIWIFFILDFVIETLGILIAIFFLAHNSIFTHGDSGIEKWKKVAFFIPIFAIVAAIFGRTLWQEVLSYRIWSQLTLVAALAGSAVHYYVLIHDPANRSSEHWGFIVIGMFLWILGMGIGFALQPPL